MKLFKHCSMIALMSFVGQAYGMSYIKGALLCVLASNGQADFNLPTTHIIATHHAVQNTATNTAKQAIPLFFPNQDALENCLKRSTFLSSSWYQEIVPEVSDFFALEQLSKKKVATASRNLVLSVLVRQERLQPLSESITSQSYNQALQRTPNVTKAMVACQTTRKNYRKQKQLWEKLTQTDWIHD